MRGPKKVKLQSIGIKIQIHKIESLVFQNNLDNLKDHENRLLRNEKIKWGYIIRYRLTKRVIVPYNGLPL